MIGEVTPCQNGPHGSPPPMTEDRREAPCKGNPGAHGAPQDLAPIALCQTATVKAVPGEGLARVPCTQNAPHTSTTRHGRKSAARPPRCSTGARCLSKGPTPGVASEPRRRRSERSGGACEDTAHSCTEVDTCLDPLRSGGGTLTLASCSKCSRSQTWDHCMQPEAGGQV